MKNKNSFNNSLSKRDFLRTGLYGIGGFCLAGLTGCRRESPETKTEKRQTKTADFINGKRSPWFSRLENSDLRCDLCPNKCRLQPGERSLCRVRENRGGEGYTVAYGNPALVQEDEIERKPFFHVLPGQRALSISTAGCNLACRFCEVWDMALVAPEDVHCYDMPPARVIEQALEAGLPALSYAFGEPVVFYEYMSETARQAKEHNLLNLLHTAAYIQPEPLKKLIPLVDAVNVDLKSFDPDFYRRIVNGELEPVLQSLKLLKQNGIHLEITNILIPTLNDDMGKIREMCKWLTDELGPGTPLHFARFYPLHRLADLPQTPVSRLDQAREIALEEGLKFVYIARVTGHDGENTYCPGCGKKIIDRLGFIIDDLQVENGKCKFCRRAIPGRWQI